MDAPSNCKAIAIVNAKTAPETTSETCLASVGLDFGRRATTMLPIKGSRPRVVNQGKALMTAPPRRVRWPR